MSFCNIISKDLITKFVKIENKYLIYTGMKESISLNWLSDMAFDAEVNGHKIYVDASVENGGKNLGPRPKPLMLVALGGCTGMDVVSLLKKMWV